MKMQNKLKRKTARESSIRGRGAAGDSEFTGRDAQYCPLWPCDGVSGLGQNARTTGGAGILPAAILRDARLKRLKWTALGETPTLLDFGEMADLREGFEIVVLG